MQDRRFRGWTFIQYDDSAPENWRSILDSYRVTWIESPLHDKDLNGNGEAKKAHRHIVFYFSGKKSYEQIKEISDSINSPRPEPVNDIRSMVRYLIHRDNPEKAQYDFSSIICHNGFDISDYFSYNKLDRYKMIGEMMDFIEANHITEFVTFCNYCRNERPDDWFHLICDNSAMIIDMHIRSMRHGFKSIN